MNVSSSVQNLNYIEEMCVCMKKKRLNYNMHLDSVWSFVSEIGILFEVLYGFVITFFCKKNVDTVCKSERGIIYGRL